MVEAKNELIAEGVDFTNPDPCISYQICERVAQKLSGEGCGVLEKPSGNRCLSNNRSVDHVCYPNGDHYDILQDANSTANPDSAGRNIPRWSYTGIVDTDRYMPVGNNPNPSSSSTTFADPVPPSEAITAMDLSMVGDRMTLPDDEFHLSLQIDKMDKVREIRVYFDVDAEVNDFTRNVYFFAFAQNDLTEAVQSFNATTVTPVIDQTETDVVPHGQVRRTGYTRTPGNEDDPNPVTDQLALGNMQWLELRWRVKDMVRVGTDPTRSLRDVKGIEILIQYPQTEELKVKYDALWIGGGYGPDVGEIGLPYIYTYRYRSSETGATSNLAPPQRAGVIPRRQRVELKATPSPDPQVNKIDFFRSGGMLPPEKFFYVGTGPNSTATFFDDYSDDNIGKDPVPFDDYQPWPTADQPRTGTCEVAGSAIKWLTGDQFNGQWAPGSQMLINGVPYTLFAQPPSATFLEVVESAGAHDSATFEIPSGTIQGTPFPTLFGPFEGFYFAVGNPTNPGQLHWTKGHNPDVTSDKNTLYVTSPSTPLQNGYIEDNACFVASTEHIYRILPDFGRPNVFTTQLMPAGRGFWTPWSWCLTPQGVVFLAKDGIYLSKNGQTARSLTDQDLYLLFPHEGVAGKGVRGLRPPDMEDREHLRLGYGDGYVFFDFRGASSAGGSRITLFDESSGGGHNVNDAETLVYDMKGDRWFLDKYDTPLCCHVWEAGAGVHHVLIGTDNGEVRHYEHGAGDDGANIPYLIRTPHFDGGDPRKEKLFGDFALSFDAQMGPGCTVQAAFNNFNIDRREPVQGPFGVGRDNRQEYFFDINDGYGELAKNICIQIEGELPENSDKTKPSPAWYWWSPSVIAKGDLTGKRATDWDDAGYFGAKWMQGVLIEADQWGGGKPEHVPGIPGPRTVRVEYDGGQLGATVTVNLTAGQEQTAHSFPSPFIAHLVRLVPTDPDDWVLYRHRWVVGAVPGTRGLLDHATDHARLPRLLPGRARVDSAHVDCRFRFDCHG